MGAFLGLLFGTGVLLVWLGLTATPSQGPTAPRPVGRLAQRIEDAGVAGVTPSGVIATCLVGGLLVALTFLAMSRVATIAIAFGLMAAFVPIAALNHRVRQRRSELRELWPDVIDNLASAVRAGLSLPEALMALSTRGPEPLRPAFAAFGEDYRANGRFNDCLDQLKARLADPTGDRVVESLRVARDVGGTDLGRLLRTLSGFLREESRTRSELQTRQGWVVNAARLAAAAPWILLALMSGQPAARVAYSSFGGSVVLAIGAAVCFMAYRAMVRIGRLPDDVRVLR